MGHSASACDGDNGHRRQQRPADSGRSPPHWTSRDLAVQLLSGRVTAGESPLPLAMSKMTARSPSKPAVAASSQPLRHSGGRQSCALCSQAEAGRTGSRSWGCGCTEPGWSEWVLAQTSASCLLIWASSLNPGPRPREHLLRRGAITGTTTGGHCAAHSHAEGHRDSLVPHFHVLFPSEARNLDFQ